jgi:hypothetical protein
MIRVPYDARKGILLLMLHEEKLTVSELYDKAYFITGHHRKKAIRSYISHLEGIFEDNNGLYHLNIEKCPTWLQYALYIKRNGTVTTTEIARAFGHPQCKVHNEMYRYMDIFNFGKDKNKNTYELKLGDISNKEADKL